VAKKIKGSSKKIDLVSELIKIGIALSSEHNLHKLLEMIVDQAQRLTNADGGTLYIVNDDGTALDFAIVRNISLDIRMGGTGTPINWKPVSLFDNDGKPNHTNVSSYVALSGEAVNISDVYHAKGFNFEGTKRFDAGTGYRSKSMLVVPMRNHENDIIGVLQLLNAKDANTGKVIKFSQTSQDITLSLASQAAIALTNNRLINDLANLLESFIKSIAAAIDEKSPYTGGHIKRVAELTMDIANRINRCEDGFFKDVYFSRDELNELRIAAWLHDIGKITTPEHVVDKATKLETICDRITLLKTRFEVIKRDYEIKLLKERMAKEQIFEPIDAHQKDDKFLEKLQDDLEFIIKLNNGSEFVSDEMLERLKSIKEREWFMDGVPMTLLTDDEAYNLNIKRGTLNDEERKIITNHVFLTYKMLSQLPFPKKLKNVPKYAAAHHECLNGTGYPFGLKEDEIPIQARIIALADVFEALTAKDRPYKKAKTLSEALKILSFMVKDRHIDPILFDFFIKERIYLDYAKKELSPSQIDIEDL